MLFEASRRNKSQTRDPVVRRALSRSSIAGLARLSISFHHYFLQGTAHTLPDPVVRRALSRSSIAGVTRLRISFHHYFLLGTARWTDDLLKIAWSRWMQVAMDRSLWKSIGEAFVQQWTAIG
ncbi:hypothetical protein ACJJTC_016131 [Scirpophaga incertulas]